MHLLSVAALFPLSVAGAVVEHWWNVAWVDGVNPDGLQPRRMIGVNGTWPPPILEVNRGDQLIVHATNGLDFPASLHHHGMFFNGSSYYDGSVAVTQCGIPSGATFTYSVPTANQHGTYWAHGHNAGLYIDGFRTPFIIHNTREVHSYDAEYTVILSDHYHDEHKPLNDHFLSIANPGGAEPVPNAGLMYFAQNSTYLSGYNENATLPFVPGKTYRLRIINMSGLAMFVFAIDGHAMSVIELDGVDVEPYPVDYLSISAAQRYSVLVTALNATDSNYLVHANMDPAMFDVIPDNLVLNVTSTIVYEADAPVAAPVDFASYDATSEVAMVPVDAEPMAPADVSIDLNVWFDTYDDGTPRAAFNNVTWNAPNVPALMTAMSMGSDAMNPAVYGPNAFVIRHRDVVQLNVFNWDAGHHPFHLHGHKFQVVYKSGDVTSNDTTINPSFNDSQSNPIRRDTVTVAPTGLTSIRFRSDNPGTWLFHCHVDWHMSQGLVATFIAAPDVIQTLPRPPQFVYDQCTAQSIATTGNAAGLNSTTDFDGLTVGPYPLVLGWTPRAKGAMAGCVLTAFIGLLTVVWYSFLGNDVSDEEHEEEVRLARQARLDDAQGGSTGKLARGSRAAKRLFARSHASTPTTES